MKGPVISAAVVFAVVFSSVACGQIQSAVAPQISTEQYVDGVRLVDFADSVGIDQGGTVSARVIGADGLIREIRGSAATGFSTTLAPGMGIDGLAVDALTHSGRYGGLTAQNFKYWSEGQYKNAVASISSFGTKLVASEGTDLGGGWRVQFPIESSAMSAGGASILKSIVIAEDGQSEMAVARFFEEGIGPHIALMTGNGISELLGISAGDNGSITADVRFEHESRRALLHVDRDGNVQILQGLGQGDLLDASTSFGSSKVFGMSPNGNVAAVDVNNVLGIRSASGNVTYLRPDTQISGTNMTLRAIDSRIAVANDGSVVALASTDIDATSSTAMIHVSSDGSTQEIARVGTQFQFKGSLITITNLESAFLADHGEYAIFRALGTNANGTNFENLLAWDASTGDLNAIFGSGDEMLGSFISGFALPWGNFGSNSNLVFDDQLAIKIDLQDGRDAIARIQFSKTSSIPEPRSTLIIGALAAAALLARRRKKLKKQILN